MKLGLILQTITKNPFIILTSNYAIKKFIYVEKKALLSTCFISSLKKIFPSQESLEYVATSIGPGSFTNIRIGATIATTISYALDIPLIGFSSLEMCIPKTNGHFANILDAKSSGIYYLKGEKTSAGCVFAKPQMVGINEAQSVFNKMDLLFSLEENESLQKKLENDKIQPSTIDPFYLIQVIYQKFSKKNYTKNRKLKLLYMRQS